MSAVRSRATNFRARSIGIFALRPTARSSRRTTRSRSGELDGAPTSREVGGLRGDRPDRDVRVAQRQPAEQHLQGIHQRCVAAPVPGQRRVRAGRPGGAR